MTEQKRVLVVGGGISGLTAAYYLQKEQKQKNLPLDVQLIEASDQLGGKIKTEKRDGFTIERGPDSFLARKESAARLAEEVGLGDQLVPNGTGQSYILVNGKLHKMPSGSFMGIPTRIRPFLFSGLFTPAGKLRASLDLIKPKKQVEGDQGLGLFFRRRLGSQVVENLIEPLLSGIYAGDIDKLSLEATFPDFYRLEQEYGSLIKGLRKTRSISKPKKGEKKPSMFRTLEHGLESLVDAVEDKLDPGSVRKNTKVDHIERKPQGYHVLLSDGTVEEADAVILAVPHFQAQRMLSQFDFMDPFKEVNATSVANVAMAFDESAIKKDIDGTGFVVSRNSSFRITACTWTHKKWPHSTPAGKVMLRCYVGKPDDQDVVNLPDEDIVEIALNDLNKTMNITDKPDFSIVTRWYDAMPQYQVGHKDRLAEITEQLDQHLPGVCLAGGSYRGIGLPDCIDQGEAAVEKVLSSIKDNRI
ncbi:protoporphyrinogen oxidase [Halobacillus halophilus]|uniref:Coproporphyrinogen III oxidase n=1 Tax=Halobacillus halophilus (strain ATCC 35676 / DSM 2266 / JCM 20832 / KCTC 3685 / LMG 17431 / NBRC 102448 / NCIMB 2269) TaxID=866895 RepID=I0JKB5_HALH3|nr:protoporphyrinogen oxidase [Halobacillus halophilus]ASF38730.1 protoporphyrinogen oxidase [Halobacillus halophilus]CCG44584.1 protoporphyrinogen oxidase [Halobacillus halophilus DSM 2266]